MQINEDELKFLQTIYLTFGAKFKIWDVWKIEKLKRMYMDNENIRHLPNILASSGLGHLDGDFYILSGYPSREPNAD